MIRYLVQEEKKYMRPLYQLCFEDDEAYCDYYFEKRLPNNEVAVCEEDENIKGMIHLIPKKLVCGVDDLTNNCKYLYAVATHPNFRKQGIMGKILYKVLLDLQQQGDTFCYLIPSSVQNAKIYEKYAFVRVMDRVEYQSSLPAWIETKTATAADIPSLAEFAEQEMRRKYCVYLKKDVSYFREIMELMEVDGGEILLYLYEGNIVGYRIGSEEEIIEEIRSERAFLGKYEIVYDLTNTNSADISDSVEKMPVRHIPYAMARILNIPQLLRHFRVEEQGHIYIEIRDALISENDGVFLWEYGAEGNRWQRTSHAAEISVSIEEFAAYVFGYRDVCKTICKSTSKKLPQIITKQGFFINDYV